MAYAHSNSSFVAFGIFLPRFLFDLDFDSFRFFESKHLGNLLS